MIAVGVLSFLCFRFSLSPSSSLVTDVEVVSLADVDVMGDVGGSGLAGDFSLLSSFVSTKLLAVKNPKLSILEPLLLSCGTSMDWRGCLIISLANLDLPGLLLLLRDLELRDRILDEPLRYDLSYLDGDRVRDLEDRLGDRDPDSLEGKIF